MKTALRLLVAGLPLVLTATAASAADLGVRYAPPAPVPVAVASAHEGWYLRGDIGVSVHRSENWKESEFETPALPDNIFNGWRSKDSDNSANLAVGVGYQFNDWLRGDLTAEYRTASKLRGIGGIYQLDDTDYTSVHGAKLDSWVFLANVYADIADFNGLTPYVGVGVGAALNRMYDARQDTVSVAGYGSYGIYGNDSKWNLAAALYAGLDYELTKQLSLDVGYRFLWLGDAQTKAGTCYQADGTETTCSGDNPKWWANDLMSHDVRVGLRYKFFDDTPAHMPVVAKN